MELDGKAFYLKAAQQSGAKFGRELLQSLANEEDHHRLKFEKIFEAVRNEKGWPETSISPGSGQRLRTIFAQASQETPRVKTPTTELDAVKTAIEKESQSYDFYKGRATKATHNTERDFYERLSTEERGHHLILLDYYEYLKDPAGWFVKKEHPSLDGN